tara:strand:+ start:321 stop:467 length:147 start_codon:yes stop_codon:yes gene_type:complete
LTSAGHLFKTNKSAHPEYGRVALAEESACIFMKNSHLLGLTKMTVLEQ